MYQLVSDTRQGAVTPHERPCQSRPRGYSFRHPLRTRQYSSRILSSYYNSRKGHYWTKRFDAFSVKQVSGNNTNYKLNELT